MSSPALDNQTALPVRRRESAVDVIWRIFCSLKLAIFLIAAIAAASVASTFILQNKPIEELKAVYSGQAYFIFRQLGLFDIFHSTWFVFLVVLLALNLIACSIERFPLIWRLMHLYGDNPSEKDLRRQKFTAEVTVPDAALRVEELAALGRQRFDRDPVITRREDGVTIVSFEKHRWGRTGVYGIHVSLLVIFYGALVGNLWGFEGLISIPEGSTVDNFVLISRIGNEIERKLGFEIRCNDFDLQRFSNGSPMAFKSSLSVFQNGQKVKEQVIDVNEPLEWGGMTFYQSSYVELGARPAMEFTARNGSGELQQYRLFANSLFHLPGDERLSRVTGFSPDYRQMGPALMFTVNADGGESGTWTVFDGFTSRDKLKIEVINTAANTGETKSAALDGVIAKDGDVEWVVYAYKEDREGLGPAVRLAAREPGGEMTMRWIYQNHPRLDALAHPDSKLRFVFHGREETASPWSFAGLAMTQDQAFATGIQMAREPGARIVLVGFVMFMVGLAVTWLMSHRRVWLRIEGDQVFVSGNTHRYPGAFGEWFDGLCDELAALGGKPAAVSAETPEKTA
ncbi:MAG: Cytochrome c biogenesis protein Ccs1 [Myxococcota bacterium]|nr:Cytochrome c biogenesis protein Ccs1 [Myxococcota bacterium]